MKSSPGTGTFETLLRDTNCERQAYFPKRDGVVPPALLDGITEFTGDELQRRFERGTTPNRNAIEETLVNAEYISAVWSHTRSRLVGVGEIYRTPQDEHEVATLWSEEFVTGNRSLAHFRRRVLVGENVRHVLETARDSFHAKTIVAYVCSFNQKAARLMERNGFRPTTHTSGHIIFKKHLDQPATTLSIAGKFGEWFDE